MEQNQSQAEKPGPLPHQRRVLEERSELCARMDRQDAFTNTIMYRALPDYERQLMQTQMHYMACYADVLKQRLALWGMTP